MNSDLTNELNPYFDNAATSWPKPERVYKAAEKHMRSMAGNPGRSGNTRTLDADRLIYQTREAVADLFNVSNTSRIVFTLNATDALNIALKGFLKQGDHVLYTAMEHNSVLRPLARLKADGIITATMIPCSEEGFPNLDYLGNAYQSNTRLLVVNHASNVTGTILPVEKLAASAHKHGAAVLIDASQTAGTTPIDLANIEADMLAFTGHKGLLGPTGTGGLYVRTGLDLKPLREGGTGSQSEKDIHPEQMPERLEAGTLNSVGLAGLLEGILFIQETGVDIINEREKEVYKYLRSQLQKVSGLNIYGPKDLDRTTCIISFTLDNIDCGEVGFILESEYGLLTRTGLHCAPFAHKTIGTYPQGTVRLSPGYFTTRDDIDYLVDALNNIAELAEI